MTLEYTRTFAKDYAKLPDEIRKKLDRQLKNLTINFRHPSLHTKRVKGFQSIWEARIDYQHRITFVVKDDIATLRRVGPHDVLSKP